MGRFSYEKNIPKIGGRGGKKGKRAKPNNQFKNQCGNCGGDLPCNDSGCRKASGQDSYNSRNKPAPKTKTTSKKKAKVKPALSKSKFISNLRKSNPSISDSAAKSALKKAGYSSCGIIVLVALGISGTGIYELFDWVIG